METKPTNRWLIVAGGVLINLMLGVTYTWSIFGSTLANATGPYKWSNADQTLAFSVMLLFFGITMPIAGRIQDKKGPRLIALIGGILLGLGFLASSMTINMTLSIPLIVFTLDIKMLCITYGVLAGCGVGFAYGAPIAAGNKWFPDKRGLIAGIMVFGFGFGSVLLAPIAQVMIGGLPAQPKGLIQPIIVSVFQMPALAGLLKIGLENTFMYLGATFLVVICVGALVLKNPPAGWKPEGWDPSKSKKAITRAYKEFTTSEMTKTRQFWMLWVMFIFTAAAGLMVIGFLNKFAELCLIEKYSYPAQNALLEGAVAVSVLAIFNGIGRIFAGWLSDQIGRAKTMFILFGLQAILMASFVYLTGTSIIMIYVVMAMIGLCFGACFSLFPSTTADFFGAKNSGANYGILFTSYGLGGILGPMLSVYMLPATPHTGDYVMPGLILGTLVGIAAVMALIIKAPKVPSSKSNP